MSDSCFIPTTLRSAVRYKERCPADNATRSVRDDWPGAYVPGQCAIRDLQSHRWDPVRGELQIQCEQSNRSCVSGPADLFSVGC